MNPKVEETRILRKQKRELSRISPCDLQVQSYTAGGSKECLFIFFSGDVYGIRQSLAMSRGEAFTSIVVIQLHLLHDK